MLLKRKFHEHDTGIKLLFLAKKVESNERKLPDRYYVHDTRSEEIPFIVDQKEMHAYVGICYGARGTHGKFTAVPYVQPSTRPLQGQRGNPTLYANARVGLDVYSYSTEALSRDKS